MPAERLARGIVLLLVVAAIAIPVAVWKLRPSGVILHARMAETGGWLPENLSVEVGQPLHLRLTSDDVVHSFAIGQSDAAPVDVLPGMITELTLTFDKPGKYTFYCTRWCSVNHWRMRGTIEVTGTASATHTTQPPLYVTLGLDIDGEHHAEAVPGDTPSAGRGAQLVAGISTELQSREYYLSHSPEQLWQALRGAPTLGGLDDQQVWDLVALTWQSHTTPLEIETGRILYNTNCAACHGNTGAGDGVYAQTSDQTQTGEHNGAQNESMAAPPTDFTDPRHMLSASPARLQGKILRGGMGSGMPYWGPIFTDDQTWALVAYLWTFQFELENKP